MSAAALPFTTADAEARYEEFIPNDTPLITTFPLKCLYRMWKRDEPFHAVSTPKTPIHYWVGDELYTIHYEIKWSLYKDIGYPSTSDCNGYKCRSGMFPSLDDWCTACHGDPYNMDASEFIKLMLSEEPFTDSLKFHHLYRFENMIDGVTATSITRVADPDRMEHSAKIANDLKTRTETIAQASARLDQHTHKITTLSEQMVELEMFLKTSPPLIQDILHREKDRMVESSATLAKEQATIAAALALQQSELDTLHTTYGFASRAAMEMFLVETHSKASADLLAKARAKLAV